MAHRLALAVALAVALIGGCTATPVPTGTDAPSPTPLVTAQPTDQATEQPTPTPSDQPMPTPAASPTGAQEIACGFDGSSPITLTDHSGLVDSCDVEEGAIWTTDITVTRAIISGPENLVVTWPHSLCGSIHPADLEFWGPLAVGPAQPGYVLHVSRLPSNRGLCSGWGDIFNQGVSLLLHGDVSADDVDASVSNSDSDGNSRSLVNAYAASGRFVLQLTGRTEGWSTTEPIQLLTSVQYIEGRDKVTAIGLATPVFGLEQLDGPLEISPPPTTLQCPASHPVVFERDVAQDASFHLFGYDEVRLGPGTYRLYALLDFFVGDNCQGEHVRLTASVVIQVR